MTKLASLGLVVISVFMVSCAENNQNQIVTSITDIDSKVGWLHGNCLAIKNPSIESGTPLTLVQLNEPQHVTSASVLTKVQVGEACFPLLEDRRAINVSSGYSFYSLNAEKDIDLAIGVVEEHIDLDQYSFSYCTTSEGIMYSMKDDGQSADGELWHGYYYLGYDSEVTCGIPE